MVPEGLDHGYDQGRACLFQCCAPPLLEEPALVGPTRVGGQAKRVRGSAMRGIWTSCISRSGRVVTVIEADDPKRRRDLIMQCSSERRRF